MFIFRLNSNCLELLPKCLRGSALHIIPKQSKPECRFLQVHCSLDNQVQKTIIRSAIHTRNPATVRRQTSPPPPQRYPSHHQPDSCVTHKRPRALNSASTKKKYSTLKKQAPRAPSQAEIPVDNYLRHHYSPIRLRTTHPSKRLCWHHGRQTPHALR